MSVLLGVANVKSAPHQVAREHGPVCSYTRSYAHAPTVLVIEPLQARCHIVLLGTIWEEKVMDRREARAGQAKQGW
jgi:hypothetical protein